MQYILQNLIKYISLFSEYVNDWNKIYTWHSSSIFVWTSDSEHREVPSIPKICEGKTELMKAADQEMPFV
jgi:hypothetical protein